MAFDKRNLTIVRCLDCGAEKPETAGENDFVRIVSEADGIQTVECRKCGTTGTFELPPEPEPVPEPLTVDELAEAVADLVAKLNEKGLIP